MTSTQTITTTATAARVRKVLHEVFVDLLGLSTFGVVDQEDVNRWVDDLQYMLTAGALSSFELRAYRGSTVIDAWRYTVSDDGSLSTGERGGGIDSYSLRTATKVTVAIQKRNGLTRRVLAEIESRGWTRTVESLAFPTTERRVYAADGYGLIREKYRL